MDLKGKNEYDLIMVVYGCVKVNHSICLLLCRMFFGLRMCIVLVIISIIRSLGSRFFWVFLWSYYYCWYCIICTINYLNCLNFIIHFIVIRLFNFIINWIFIWIFLFFLHFTFLFNEQFVYILDLNNMLEEFMLGFIMFCMFIIMFILIFEYY